MSAKIKFYFCVLILLAALAGQCLYSAWTQGQVTDETYFTASGYPMVRHNDYRFLGEQPPLASQIAALPLLLLQPHFDIKTPVYLPNSNTPDISRNGARFLYEMGNNPALLLFLERLPIIFLTLILGLGIALFGREIGGAATGILSLFLYAFDPNIIAHGSLDTTDMGLTVFYFFSVYALKRFFDCSSAKNAAVLGCLCGATFLSKISGLALFPVVTLLFLIHFYLTRNQTFSASTEPSKVDWKMGALAFFLLANALGQKQAMASLGPLCLLTLYLCFRNLDLFKKRGTLLIFKILLGAGFILAFFFALKLKKKYGLQASFIFASWNIITTAFGYFLLKYWDTERVIVFVKRFLLVWLIAGLCIILDYTDFFQKFYRFTGFGHYVQPFGIVLAHSMGGHRICVEGSFVTCDWRYFFGVISVKTPLLTLALALIGFGIVFLNKQLKKITKALLLIPPAVIFSAAVFTGINIGIRHILSIFTFLFLWGGLLVVWLDKQIKQSFLKWGTRLALFILFLLFAIRSLMTAPDFIAYFNETVGTVENGARLVADSNINWGQDNRRLAEYILANKIANIRIASDAENGDVYNYYGIQWSRVIESELLNPEPGYYAIGVGVYARLQKNATSFFYKKEPMSKAGKTFYIFSVPAH